MRNKANILTHYLACALWCEELEGSKKKIAPSSIEQAKKDIDLFVDKNESLLDKSGQSDEQIGHDFWLSRNHHGAGFFDRGLGEIGVILQKNSQTFKELNVFDDEANIIIE